MIILNNNSGQLCNKLVLYANVYATAIETKQRLIHLYWIYAEHKFDRCEHNNVYVFPIRLNKLFHIYDKYIITPKVEKGFAWNKKTQEKKRQKLYDGSAKHITVIDSWYYRDYGALFKNHDKICEIFKPTEVVQDNINSFWSSLQITDGTPVVGVHMRRGDYKYWNGGKLYFSDVQYRDWMEEMASSIDKAPCFICCSNEFINIDNIKSDNYSVYLALGEEMEDLYTLARCDYIFGPVSTYSWWAAYYGEKMYLALYGPEDRVEKTLFNKVRGDEFIYQDIP